MSLEVIIIAAITVVEALLLYICLIASHNSKNPLTNCVRNSLRLAIILLIMRGLMLFVSDRSVGYVLYGVFSVCQILFYVALGRYLMDLSNQTSPVWAKRLYFALIGADIVSFAIGYFTGHAYTYSFVNGAAVVDHRIGYFLHTGLKIILLIYLIVMSLIKIQKTHFIYWQRYGFFAGCIGIGLMLDITHVGSFNALEYPGIVLFIAGLVLYLFTCVFRSTVLRASMYSEVFNSLPQYTILLDNEGEIALVNEGALSFFDIDEYDYSAIKWRVLEQIEKEGHSILNDEKKIFKYVKDGNIYYLRVDRKALYHKDKFAGEIFGFTDITEAVSELREEQKKAQFDAFTGVYNHEYLMERMEEMILENPEKEYYIIGSDVRDFKVFNEVFGKEAGDLIITKTGEIMNELFEEGRLDLFGRIYADRFGMMVEKEKFSESAIIGKFMEIGHPFNEEYYHLNIHFGVYRSKMDEGISVKAMFDRAYVALDAIKNDVNIRLYHYNEMMRDEKIWEQTISGNIERAIKDGQLRIVVQPQVDNNEHVIGGEALVRWRHPENGEISPGNFIPVLEKTGLVTNADFFVWEECCKLLRRWKDLGFEEYYISVNISPTDFIFADIYTIFTDLVKKYEISPRNLKLEITETAVMTDVLERIVLIKRLEEFGFNVELDDFGSGYSSLNMLKEIPVDVIKMDMKFLYNYNDSSTSNSRKIISHIIQMAKDLNMEIVAEGVETADQLNFLKNTGCDIFQGYYFSKPIEVSEFEHREGIA